MTALPAQAPLGIYLKAAALSTKEAFVKALPGVGALVRLDERGGHDEPSPWAWDVLLKELPADEDSGEEDRFLDIASTQASDEATATGPAQPPLPIPKARETATVYVLPPEGARIGRRGDLRIAERSLSRAHALISVEAAGCFVVDLGSDNGTAVNGILIEGVKTKELRSGDVLQLADVVFLYLDAAAFFTHLPALGEG